MKTEGSLIARISSNQLPADPAQAEQKRFRSILFSEPISIGDLDTREAPEFFIDLNLDQIVASITANRDEYNLKPFFYTPLKSVDAICYRYEILRDLEIDLLYECVHSFADSMRRMRSNLSQAEKLYYKRQKQAWFLDALEVYCNAIRQLGADLASPTLRSRGFQAFHDFVRDYLDSPRFLSLARETETLKTDLSAIRYSLQIHGKRIKAAKYNSESDYSAEVLRTFDKFKQVAPKEYRFEVHSTVDMNHVEAAILDLVAELFPETFSFLDEYCNRHSGFLDATISAFDREVQFYMACMEYAARFKQAGLSLCHAVVTNRSKEIFARDAFDLALANHLVQDKTPVVTNDLHLNNPERIFVVSGPNQGGKTTFARMFGQLHYLASIGCPVPAREARVFLFDQLFTHFERQEELRNLTGKLEDELLRMRRILEFATPNSILIMNESFLSTTLKDALFLSKQIMEQIISLDMLCVSVTFLDEIASLSTTTVSMVSSVNAEDPALRTFKIIRRPADGLAYAAAIAEKHRLTYHGVKARVTKNAEERPAT